MKVQIYTDGSCIGNNTKDIDACGGWAAIVTIGGSHAILVGGSSKTTNNVMEMEAVINGLSYARTIHNAEVEVLTDSMYVIKGCTEWRYGWIARNWRKTGGEPVLNKDKWLTLFELVDCMNVKFTKVKGHSGDPLNDKCDKLACEQSKLFSQKIKI